MDMVCSAEASQVGSGNVVPMQSGLAKLTPTQLKVLQGVHSGLANKQIAFDLGISEGTVKGHMTALMRKLQVRNRTQVAVVAQISDWPISSAATL